ncbi:hypothetical protein [Campylobacter upsaliensis]|uniref:Uncharacterized protein n=1 Tax=Campylobacter upsaliensis TaxID=28080 RepID=A0A381EJ53_CAMUP|nr:hypothetical protein [Campylobacter upsaliensis]SUX27041.1 Uncharacterised protein [Campylobacter upsaliensis]SUX27556.1 Uncharacterised protein [Campylobacter upsaliensis]
MTILTCDYNGHKEIYTADGKEVDYSTFCDLQAQNAIEANQNTLKAFFAKHKNKPNLAGFKIDDILVSSSDYYPTFFKVIGTSEKTLIIAPLKALKLREKDGGLCTPTKAYDYEAFLGYEKFLFRVTKERLKIKLSQSQSLEKPQSPVLSFMDYLD